MTTGGNNAETAIIVRAVNEASDELNQIGDDTEEVSGSLFNFSRNAVTAGIASLGLSFGLNEVLKSADQAREIDAQTDAILRLLGPEVENAFRDLEPLFEDVGGYVGKLGRDVEKAALIVTQNAGGIVPSLDELIFVFDLAAAAGVDFETAAEAVGQALQGNLEPLNQLLDPSGRSYVSLQDAMEDLNGTANETVGGFDRLWLGFQRLLEMIGRFLDDGLDWLLDKWLIFRDDILPSVTRAVADFARDAWNGMLDFVDNVGKFFGEDLPEFFTEDLPAAFRAGIANIRTFASDMWDSFYAEFIEPVTDFFSDTLPGLFKFDLPDLDLNPRNWFSSYSGQPDSILDTAGSGSAGTGGDTYVDVTINGNVDSAERVQEMARSMARQLQQNNRRGVNVSA